MRPGSHHQRAASCTGEESLDFRATPRRRHCPDRARRWARSGGGHVGQWPARDARAVRGAVGTRGHFVEARGRVRGAGVRAEMIRVVLIDDQTLVRRGIRALLELAGDITIAAEAADGIEGAAVVRRERPDVVLLDVRMPGATGIDLLRELQGKGELPPTILLTTFD